MRLIAALLLATLAAVPCGAADSPPDYVGSAACADCHRSETDAWAGSHHAAAWTAPESDRLLGDFDDARFEEHGVVTEFTRDGTGPRITVTEPDGRSNSWPVHSVVGIAPLQQYLLETAPGRQQSFDTVWDTENSRWYALYPDQALTPDDGLHWTGAYKTWNARCAECHATGYEKNYDPATRFYASTQAEIGVGCEACHGPGAAHLGWAAGRAVPSGLTASGLTVDLAQGGDTLIQQCAGCHSRREAYGNGNPLPGTAFDDAYRLALLRPGLYHPDGQIQDEVYVYGSFLQSKMYAKGVVCSDCHDAHAASLRADGNALCVQCHNPAGNPRFPSLPLADYDSPAHHFHPDGSPGAACKSCHMIERVYMGTDGRRDHSFRVPRPDLSQSLGTPNACTDCHADKTARWAAAELAARFPASRHRGSHWGQTLAAGRFDPVVQRRALLDLAREPQMPGIVRATALELLAPAADPDLAARAAGLLADPLPLIRANAVAVQRGAPDQDRVLRLLPLLEDPSRSVRIATARALLDAPIARLPGRSQTALQGAMGDWRRSLQTNADFPEVQLVLGGIALTLRNLSAAEAAFAEAVHLDPQLVPAWTMRARIAAAQGDREAVRDLLRAALNANPGDPALSEMLSSID
ncbi:MAG: hypothetical protein KDA50_11380 [Rhodobacteraceae bacterium]|nr:hypothetical protein [Paracoccaceae bacterium]